MRHIAKALAAQGRGPDTELLHVTKNELNHLAGLAGLKELPRNPKTGLPEAGLFESILPIVGGIAGGVLTGGNPLGVAAGSGLGSKLAGGSDQDMLRSAAIGGIGAGLTQGADKLWMSGDAAGTAAASAAPAATGASTTGALQQAAASTAPEAALFDPANLTPAQMAGTEVVNPGIGAYQAPQVTAASLTPPPAAQTGMWDKAVDWMGKNKLQTGILGLTAANALMQPSYQAPEKRRVEMKGQARSNRTYTGGVPAAGASPYAERQYFADNSPYNYTQGPSTYEMRYAEGGEVQPQGYQHTQFQSAYQPGLNTQVAPGTVSPAMQAAFPQAGAAQSGIGSLPAAGTPTGGIDYSDPNWYANAVGQSAAANPGTVSSALAAGNQGVMDKLKDTGLGYLTMGQFVPGMGSVGRAAGDFMSNTLGSIGGAFGFAKGGELNLRGHSKTMDPMFLKGAGDGMSDSIPAYIDGGGAQPNEPIRVADGEYILSSDVVSALGGGSSNAGARKLDKLVDKVRRTAHGTKKQVKPVRVKVAGGIL